MADNKRVYTVEYFELMDGTEVEVKPLPIKRLRKAQSTINKVIRQASESAEQGGDTSDAEDFDDQLIDALIDTVLMVMQGQEKCSHFTTEEGGREALEDTIDQESMYEIVRVSTGFDFLGMKERAEKAMEGMLTS